MGVKNKTCQLITIFNSKTKKNYAGINHKNNNTNDDNKDLFATRTNI